MRIIRCYDKLLELYCNNKDMTERHQIIDAFNEAFTQDNQIII